MVERIGVGRDESESGEGRVRKWGGTSQSGADFWRKPRETKRGRRRLRFLGRAEVRGEGVSWQSPSRGGGRWCVVVVTLGWYVPRPTTPSARLRRVAAPLPPCLGVSSSRAGRREGRGRGPPGDGRSPRPIGGPWSSRRRRCRRRERGARARPAPVRTTTGGLEARSASWRRSSRPRARRRAWPWRPRAGKMRVGNPRRAPRLESRRSRRTCRVPVPVPLQVSSSARPISERVEPNLPRKRT